MILLDRVVLAVSSADVLLCGLPVGGGDIDSFLSGVAGIYAGSDVERYRRPNGNSFV